MNENRVTIAANFYNLNYCNRNHKQSLLQVKYMYLFFSINLGYSFHKYQKIDKYKTKMQLILMKEI